MNVPPADPRTRVTAQTRSLRFDAGSLALNLLATLGRRGGTPVERMGSVERLGAWLEGVGLRPAEDAVTEGLLTDLWVLREAAYDVAVADLRAAAPALASVALVNECAHPAPPAPRLEPAADTVGVEEAVLSGRQIQSLVARDLIALMGSRERRARLRECGSPVCRMVYLDSTPGMRRRWCSMRRCGNTVKAAKHRELHGPA